MKKAVLFLAVVLCFLMLTVSAQADILIKYLGGQVIMDSETRKLGMGTVGGLGIQLSEYLILYGQVENEEPHSGQDFDYVLAGTTFLWPDLAPKLRLGGFLNTGIGTGGEQGKENTTYATMVGGVYFNIRKVEKQNIYLGAGYSSVEGLKTWSFHFGISFERF